MALTKQERRSRIKLRIKKRITGTSQLPRLSVFRSNKNISVQIIDDISGNTLASASSKSKELVDVVEKTKSEKAALVGKLIAEKALQSGIEAVVFDRNGYLYHGRVKSLAEAARKNGLKF